MNTIIPYGKQLITQEDINEVVSVLKSDYLTQGPKILEFEKKFAEYVNAKYAIAVSNGTAALHLSALAMNIQKGQKVITSPITFAASANCVEYCGGEIVFGDIDPDTYLLSIDSIEKLLQGSPKGTYCGVIPVNFAGRVIDTERLRKVCKKYNLWIIEDSCHSPGGYFKTENDLISLAGSCEFSDLSIFSFHPVKHIASGEGGMITMNDKYIYQQLLKFRSHGITKDQSQFNLKYDLEPNFKGDNSSYPGWYMEMQDLGYNYRLTDFQSALGLSQLKRADEGIKKRRNIAKVYFENLSDIEEIFNQSGIIEGHAYHLYIIQIEKRRELYEYLRSKNIFTQVHYIPCHLMPFYRKKGWNIGDRPNSEKYYETCLSLPMYPSLTVSEQEHVINSIKTFYGR
jgi:UDP-4-amino-4,6-dideoxy-N-acetyl-beta-L-altrosamine transaminase